ncbi:hypothetical protein ENBRE01_3507, partial [Enteropsectra breve]
LGIIEDNTSRISEKLYNKLLNEILERTKKICKTSLNGKNVIHTINEHAISIVNYYLGVLRINPEDLAAIDNKIRQILNTERIHLQPANKERLYLPRQELGRGMVNVEHRSETMLLNIFCKLEERSKTCARAQAILEIEKKCATPLGLIKEYLKVKYNAQESITMENIIIAQKNYLYNEIKNKKIHQKLYKIRDYSIIDIKNSSLWLTHGNNSPNTEAHLAYLQDRNVFFGERGLCPHCNRANKTVDHLATQCEKMLFYDYTRRHNEVVKAIHLNICTKY